MNSSALPDSLIRDISPHDEMWAGDKHCGDWYWVVGQSALDCVQQSLRSAGKLPADIHRILDLPCGHGRVLRHLKVGFPSAEITACDLLSDGVDFCAATFGAIPVHSHEDPLLIPLPKGAFDLIWVGSLFTHLDERRWKSLLSVLAASLAEGGLLVFTAHGRRIYQRMRGMDGTYDFGIPYWRKTLVLSGYERTGFSYGNYGGTENYGVSLSDPVSVCRLIGQVRELSLVHFAAEAWHGAHDVYACMRRPKEELDHPQIPTSLYLKHWILEFLPRGVVRAVRALLGRG